MPKVNGLTPKQKALADYFIETGNASEAARRAGYKNHKNIGIDAVKTLKKPVVAAYVEEKLKPKEDQRIATAEEVMQFFTDVMNGRVKDQFGLDASLTDRLNAGKELMKRHAVVDATKKTDSVTVVIDV